MRALRLAQTGDPADLAVRDVPEPSPGPGEIVVRVRFAALNRRDLFIARGRYPKIALPCTLGSDAWGEVAMLGEGVGSPPLGTAVVIDPQLDWSDEPAVFGTRGSILGMPRDGTFAEFVVVPATNVHVAPRGLAPEEAAAIPLAGLTAFRALVTRGRLQPSDVVLLTGIGGGVQTFALALAVGTAARTVVTSGSDAKIARARDLGAYAGVNYRTSPDWRAEVRALTGGGPTLVIDAVGGETFAGALDVARPGARVVTYGGTAGDATIRPFSIFRKHLDVLGTSMGSPADFAGMLRRFDDGLRPVVEDVVPFSRVTEALRRLESGDQFGKLVLRIDA